MNVSRWVAVAAVFALAVVGGVTAVLIGRSPTLEEGRRSEEGHRAHAAADSILARGGPAPPGQTPVAALTVPGFRSAFQGEAGTARLLVLLSPT